MKGGEKEVDLGNKLKGVCSRTRVRAADAGRRPAGPEKGGLPLTVQRFCAGSCPRTSQSVLCSHGVCGGDARSI